MTDKKPHRAFDPAFKLQVVEMIREQSLSIGQVCKDMNLVDSAIRRWLTQFDAEMVGRSGIGKPLMTEQQRIRPLETENRQLKSDNDLLKSVGLLRPGNEVMQDFGSEPPGPVCRPKATLPPKPVCVLSVQAKAAFEASGQSYGSRRLSAALQLQGLAVGRHRARTLMRSNGLRARWRHKFLHTTDSHHALPVAANVLARQFNPETPNRAWVCDIPYVRTRSGWLYWAVALDLFSRRVVGWSMAPSMPAQLVCAALGMASASRQPLPGLVVHSDRGSQYASLNHTALLASHGLVCSMSRKGNCGDNAVMERFFLNLKMERVWQRDYANHGEEAQADIADYIVGFYNPLRLDSTLGYRSPAQHEQQFLVDH